MNQAEVWRLAIGRAAMHALYSLMLQHCNPASTCSAEEVLTINSAGVVL